MPSARCEEPIPLGKFPARESALSLKHGNANPVAGFAWLCADGVAGFTSTALILIPLPTVLPVWTLLRNCGHCLKRRAAEPGLTAKCLDALLAAVTLPTFIASLPSQYCLLALSQNLPSPEPTTPQTFLRVFPSLHSLTATQKQDFLTLSCVYCAQDMFPNALRIILMGNIQLLRKPVTLKPPFLSAFLQGHNKAGYH